MGISNTTASALMTAKFAGLTAEDATGRGTNISDERLKLKQRIVHDVLENIKIFRKMMQLEFYPLWAALNLHVS